MTKGRRVQRQIKRFIKDYFCSNLMPDQEVYTTRNLGIGQQVVVGLSLPARQLSSQSGNISLGRQFDEWRKPTKLDDDWYTGEGLNGYVQLLGIDDSSIQLRCGAEGLEERVVTLNSPNTSYQIDLSKIDPNNPQEEQPQQIISLDIGDIIAGGVNVRYVTPTFYKIEQS
jgi:hypothetical protein